MKIKDLVFIEEWKAKGGVGSYLIYKTQNGFAVLNKSKLFKTLEEAMDFCNQDNREVYGTVFTSQKYQKTIKEWEVK